MASNNKLSKRPPRFELFLMTHFFESSMDFNFFPKLTVKALEHGVKYVQS